MHFSGMDKLIYEQMRVTITNDGATIINLLDIVHPAAKTLVDIARSQVLQFYVIYISHEFVKD